MESLQPSKELSGTMMERSFIKLSEDPSWNFKKLCRILCSKNRAGKEYQHAQMVLQPLFPGEATSFHCHLSHAYTAFHSSRFGAPAVVWGEFPPVISLYAISFLLNHDPFVKDLMLLFSVCLCDRGRGRDRKRMASMMNRLEVQKLN
jgi:hypothetical protein